MNKELGRRAISNRLDKYISEHYKKQDIEMKVSEDYHIRKFFTDSKSITLAADDFGKITESFRKRRGYKEKVTTTSEQKESFYQKINIVNECNYLHLKEGSIIENIYTGNRYKVLEISGNIIKVADEKNQYEMFTMAASDCMKVISK